MRKAINFLLCAILLFATLPISNTLVANAETEGDFTYTVSNDEATVTYFNGTVDGQLEIPATLGGYPVTNIGTYSFECGQFSSVILPESLKSIEANAFGWCSELSEIVIPSGVVTIGEYAFTGCTALTSVSLPNTIESIGNYAFNECTALTAVYISDLAKWCGITFGNADSNPIYYAKNLYINGTLTTSLIIPDGVTSIKKCAFVNCKITSAVLPSSLLKIEGGVFSGCSYLKSVTISDGVISIGDSAFSSCTNLREVKIPDTVTDIGVYAFYRCLNLASVILPNNITEIKDNTFSICQRLNSIDLPDSIKKIGTQAFSSCVSLPSIDIPQGVVEIGDWAFDGCGITSVNIPASVKKIGVQAFNCSKLAEVHITDLTAWCNIEYGYGMAQSPFNIKKLYLNGDLITELVIPEGITSIGRYAFLGCEGITSVEIPYGVTDIGAYSFKYCDDIQEIKLPDSLTTIGLEAFSCSDGFKSIVIPNSVTKISQNAFSLCTGLENVVIGNNVTKIDNYIFSSCYNLKKITIPKSVTSIGSSAFYYCDNITDVYYTGTSTQWYNLTRYISNAGSLTSATIHYCGCNNTKFLTVKDPTFETDGVTKEICSDCGTTVNEQTITKLIYGDADRDGIVNASDLSLFKQMLLNVIDYNSEQEKVIDINGNGKTDIIDLIKLKKIVAKNLNV